MKYAKIDPGCGHMSVIEFQDNNKLLEQACSKPAAGI